MLRQAFEVFRRRVELAGKLAGLLRRSPDAFDGMLHFQVIAKHLYVASFRSCLCCQARDHAIGAFPGARKDDAYALFVRVLLAARAPIKNDGHAMGRMAIAVNELRNQGTTRGLKAPLAHAW